jgi:hypothetical protein
VPTVAILVTQEISDNVFRLACRASQGVSYRAIRLAARGAGAGTVRILSAKKPLRVSTQESVFQSQTLVLPSQCVNSKEMQCANEVECSRVGKKTLLMWKLTESLSDAKKLLRVKGSEHCALVGTGNCPVKGSPQQRDFSKCPYLPQHAP